MFILASSSPRRKQLLKKLVDEFEIVVPDIDERVLDPFLSPKDLAYEEAREKAYSVASRYPNDEILSCDTIVVLEGEVLGKPNDEEDAVRMLLKEQGKRQLVISAYTYLAPGKEISRSVTTYVYFRSLSEEEIRAYVKKRRPLDKAGAYGIQDEEGLIERIEGSYDNVMGLPTEDITLHVFKR